MHAALTDSVASHLRAAPLCGRLWPLEPVSQVGVHQLGRLCFSLQPSFTGTKAVLSRLVAACIAPAPIRPPAAPDAGVVVDEDVLRIA